ASSVAIAARVSGVLPSAFPAGDPSSPEAGEDATDGAEDDATAGEGEGETAGENAGEKAGETAGDKAGEADAADADEAEPESTHLASTGEPNSVVVVADVDMLTDALCFQRALGMLIPRSANPDFLVNVADYV